MLHPVLESLFFLKVARGYISESIKNSEVEEKPELIKYIQNEASDYEVMHLVLLGEMPEEKFNSVVEHEVWQLFREAIIMNTDILKEDVSEQDIMTMIYEMGPVSELGYSSAAPILEFARSNGTLSIDYLNEYGRNAEEKSGNKGAMAKPKKKSYTGFRNKGETSGDVTHYASDFKFSGETNKNSGKGLSNIKKGAGYAGAAALGAAGIYGLYKAFKALKAKRAAAKGDSSALAKLKKQEEVIKAKIAKAKAKA